MSPPVKEWFDKCWHAEKRAIERLSFVASGPEVGVHEFYKGRKVPVVCLQVRVSMPAAGPVCDMRDVEPAWIALLSDFPKSPPIVCVRQDFPPVPHLSSRVEEYRVVCLTRREKADWWCCKTLADVVKHIYDWLCDAAAGMLVKDDDPFEPLIATGGYPVELNVDKVRTQCRNAGEIWETVCNEMLPEGGGSRLVVCDETRVSRQGDILTQVWYQDKEQATLWIDPPTTEEDLVDMMTQVGFDAVRVTHWLDRRRSQLHILMVVGIRRPRRVLGKSRDEEWVAFELKREKARERCRWTIVTRPVLESFSVAMAKSTSGFGTVEKNLLMIGAGSLGSELAEAICRSGMVRLTLVDQDRLLPHNLARHTLGIGDIGKSKAKAIAQKINGFYPEAICTPIYQNVLAMSPESLANINNGECVLDASASVALQGRLPDLFGGAKPSFIAFQVATGRGTVLIYTPDLKLIEPNLIETILITSLPNQSIISAWLDESADVVNLGGGCTALSSMIPNSIVKFGAGWVADRVLRTLHSGKWPIMGFAELLEYDPATGTTRTHRVDVERPAITEAGAWRIIIPACISSKLKECAQQALPNETGGILIGRLDRQRQIVYVADVWKAPNDSYSTRTGFSRGLAGLGNRIAMLEKDTNEYLHYVGEWHSHPPYSGIALSSLDSGTAKRMAKELEGDRIPAVCMITDAKSCSCHVVESS